MWYFALQVVSRIMFPVLFRLRVFGRSNVPVSGPVLLASNHQSFLDPPLIGIAVDRPVHYMARKSLFAVSVLFTRLIRSLNAFPVERGGGDVSGVRAAMRRLRAGAAVLVFPEATRTTTGEIGELKDGLFRVAARTGAAVVPTVIDGAFEAWPRWKRVGSPGVVWVAFGEPLRPEEFGGNAGAMAGEALRRLREMQKGLREKRRNVAR